MAKSDYKKSKRPIFFSSPAAGQFQRSTRGACVSRVCPPEQPGIGSPARRKRKAARRCACACAGVRLELAHLSNQVLATRASLEQPWPRVRLSSLPTWARRTRTTAAVRRCTRFGARETGRVSRALLVLAAGLTRRANPASSSKLTSSASGRARRPRAHVGRASAWAARVCRPRAP